MVSLQSPVETLRSALLERDLERDLKPASSFPKLNGALLPNNVPEQGPRQGLPFLVRRQVMQHLSYSRTLTEVERATQTSLCRQALTIAPRSELLSPI